VAEGGDRDFIGGVGLARDQQRWGVRPGCRRHRGLYLNKSKRRDVEQAGGPDQMCGLTSFNVRDRVQ
jgi:hypothetical protein